MTNKKKIVIAILCSLPLLFFFSLPVLAGFELDYPNLPNLLAPTNDSDIDEFTDYRVKFIIVVSGFVAFLIMVIGGIRYLFSVGNPEKMVGAREQITNAFIGLLILLSSVLILETINPNITTSEIEPLEKIELKEFEKVSPIPTAEFQSSLHTELPFGKIIEEKVLETKASVPEEERDKRKSRMDRIKDIGNNSLALAEKIIKANNGQPKGYAQDLKEASKKCSCGQAKPCCENPNPGPGCKNNLCTSKPYCTGDPCDQVRDDIQKTEKENLKVMYEGTEIPQTDPSGNSKTIKTSLRQEQETAAREIRLIKNEIDKLERAEVAMAKCPLSALDNLSDVANIKNYYNQRDWFLELMNYWPEILTKDDWATFYCKTSGTLWEGMFSSLVRGFSSGQNPLFFEITGEKPLVSCNVDIPVGEIIDRARRTGYKLVERLEMIINLNEELTKATNELHTLISQCSSQGPSSDPARAGCFSVCNKTLTKCIKSCQGKPCPDADIEKKVQEIIDIVEGKPNKPADEDKKDKEGIRDVATAKKKTKKESIEDHDTREQIGINAVVDDVVQGVLRDLGLKVRNTMKKCVSDTQAVSDPFSCQESINTVGPNGDLIKDCCYEEDWYQNCLYQCYLENGEDDQENDKYKKCLHQCQLKVAEEKNTPAIAKCLNKVNFYCCNLE